MWRPGITGVNCTCCLASEPAFKTTHSIIGQLVRYNTRGAHLNRDGVPAGQQAGSVAPRHHRRRLEAAATWRCCLLILARSDTASKLNSGKKGQEAKHT